jgi:hypothetical protein
MSNILFFIIMKIINLMHLRNINERIPEIPPGDEFWESVIICPA